MEYKRIEKNNYILHLIETDRFKELNIAVHFSKVYNPKELVYYDLLVKNIVYTSKKYNTKNKIAIKCEELYDTRVSTFTLLNGNIKSFVFNLDLLNPKYVNDKFIKDTMDFYKEVIFNPNVEDGHFNDEYFDMIKSDFINALKADKDNAGYYAYKRFDEIHLRGTPIYKLYPTVKDAEEVTSKSLYDFYKGLFSGEYKIDIFVHGEDISKYEKYIDELFKDVKGDNSKKGFELVIKSKKKYPFTEKIDSLKYNQSRLYIGYNINNITEHEMFHVLKVYNSILGNMNDSLLFNYVREKYSLCYSVNSSFNMNYPSLIIFAGINKDNYEEARKRIFETIEFMKDKKKISRLFKEAKESLYTIYNGYYDSVNSQIKHYLINEFESIEDIEDIKKGISRVTIDEVMELNNKLSLQTIYLLKGDN